MSVSASAISRVTGVAVQYKNFNAGAASMLPQRLAVIGVGNSDVAYTESKYECEGSASEIGELYGYGSPLHLAALQLFPVSGKGASFPVTFYPLKAASGATAASGSIAVTGTATAAGSMSVVIGGQKATVAVSKADTAHAVAVKIKDAIDGIVEMPVSTGTIASEGTSVALTSKALGTVGNMIKVYVDDAPAGLTFEVTQLANGTLDPSVSGALEKIGEIWETVVLSCFDYSDSDRLDVYKTWGDGRWDDLCKKPVLVFHGCTDTYATRTAVTDERPNDSINALVVSVGSVELPYVIAAKAMVNDIMTTADSNPAQNYKGQLDGLKAGDDSVQESYTTRNMSVGKGSSTNIKSGSVAELCDIVTMYHPTTEGKYPSKRYVVDIMKLMNIVYNCRLIMESDDLKGAPLVNDDTVTSNATAVQPKMVKAMFLKLAYSLADKAIIQDVDFTKDGLNVEIDSENPKRLNVRFPVKLSGNVEVSSTDVYFGFYLG